MAACESRAHSAWPFDQHAQWRVTNAEDQQQLVCTRCLATLLTLLRLDRPITIVRFSSALTPR